MQAVWWTYACLLLLAWHSSKAGGAATPGVLTGVEVPLPPLQRADFPRQLRQAQGPACGQQFSVSVAGIQSGYYYFGCFREFLPAAVPCLTFGTRMRNAAGLIVTEGWMTINDLNTWKASKNQIADWPTFVVPGSVTNCTAEILGKCDMAGTFALDQTDTYYCNVVYAQGDAATATRANRTTRVKLGGLDRCDKCT